MKAKAKKKPRVYFVRQRKAIERGIELLDVLVGRKEWLSRIDLDNFDMADRSTCVAGSVFGDHFVSGENFNGDNDAGFDRFRELLDSINPDREPSYCGFDTSAGEDFQTLQDLWVPKIKQLRKAARRS